MKTKLFLPLMFFAMISCIKKLSEPSFTEQLPQMTEREVRIAAVTKEVAEILEKVYSSNAAYNEVNTAINSGYYADERVLLKDLLFPSCSELYKSGVFNKLKVDTGIFRNFFCEILANGSYPLLKTELLSDGKIVKPGLLCEESSMPDGKAASVFSATEPIAIYFPCSKNFPELIIGDSVPSNSKMAIVKKATLVSSDRNANAGAGRAPYYCAGTTDNLCYYDVDVTGDYAYGRPTHIITTRANIKEVQAAESPEANARVYPSVRDWPIFDGGSAWQYTLPFRIYQSVHPVLRKSLPFREYKPGYFLSWCSS